MKMKVLQDEKNVFEFRLEGERHTYAALLRQALLSDKDVTFAAYKLEHPQDNHCVFLVRTDGKTAKKALADAVKAIESELSDFHKAVKKGLKDKK